VAQAAWVARVVSAARRPPVSFRRAPAVETSEESVASAESEELEESVVSVVSEGSVESVE